MKWREIEIPDPKPKPRRRHSAVIVSGALVMFGGFDGSFFNDLHILDLETESKNIISPQESTIAEDYHSLIN